MDMTGHDATPISQFSPLAERWWGSFTANPELCELFSAPFELV